MDPHTFALTHAAQNSLCNILLLVCGVWLCVPSALANPYNSASRLSITSVTSSELNVHSIKTRFTAPAILLGVERGDFCGLKERKEGGLPCEGSNELQRRETSCVSRNVCVRCAWRVYTWAQLCTHRRSSTQAAHCVMGFACLFLNSLFILLSDKDGLLYASSSHSLLNSHPQNSRILSENPILVGRGLGKYIHLSVHQHPLEKCRSFSEKSTESRFQGSLTMHSSVLGKTLSPTHVRAWCKAGGDCIKMILRSAL